MQALIEGIIFLVLAASAAAFGSHPKSASVNVVGGGGPVPTQPPGHR